MIKQQQTNQRVLIIFLFILLFTLTDFFLLDRRFFLLTRDFILESQLVEPHVLSFQNRTKDKEKNMF